MSLSPSKLPFHSGELAHSVAILRNLRALSPSPDASADCARPYRNLALSIWPFLQFDESASTIGLQSRPTILSAASRIFAAPRLRFAFGAFVAFFFIATILDFAAFICPTFPDAFRFWSFKCWR